MKKQAPVILMREGLLNKRPWRQYLVITDERCAVVEMEQAYLTGWNSSTVFVQGAADWPRLSRDQIVRCFDLPFSKPKLDNDDGKISVARLDPEFRKKLIAKAGL